MKDVMDEIGASGKPIIFWVSNSWNMNTGYAKCCREICKRLSKHYEIMHIAEFHIGDAYKPEGWPFSVHPYADNEAGGILLSHQINQLQPKAIIIQDDLFPLVEKGIHQIDFSSTNLILYCAIDGEPIASNARPIIEVADKLIAMTDWGKDVLEDEGFEDIDVIYHGIDESVWYPLENRTKKREELGTFMTNVTGTPIDFNNKFLVYTSGRNTLRKNIPDAIRSFIRFAKDKPDAMMLIHSVNYMRGDNDLPTYVKLFSKMEGVDFEQMRKQIVFFPAQSFQRGVPEEQMVTIAGVSDVFFTMSWGEGFGMQMLEAMSLGTPVISAEYTTPKELIGKDRGWLVKCDRWVFLNKHIGHNVANIQDGTDKLGEAYALWQKGTLRSKFSKQCIAFANKFTWDKVCKQWEKVLGDLI